MIEQSGAKPSTMMASCRIVAHRGEARSSGRSIEAHDIIRRVGGRDGRSIADFVECTPEAEEVRQVRREPASSFLARLAAEYGTGIHLSAIVQRAPRRTTARRASIA